jgi:hypothetical protein
MLRVQNASGLWQDNVNNPANFSRTGWLGDNTAVKYRHDLMPVSSNNTIAVSTRDQSFQEDSGTVPRSFSVEELPSIAFIANETPVRSEHITILRAAANNVRHYYGMAAVVWQEAVVSGRTQILHWTNHVLELRRAIDEVIAVVNSFDTVSTFDVPLPQWIAIEPGRPRANIMQQLFATITIL